MNALKTRDKLNEKILGYLVSKIRDNEYNSDMRWSVSISKKKDAAFAINYPGENKIPVEEDIETIVVRSMFSVAEANDILEGNDEILPKVIGNMEWVLMQTVKINNLNPDEFTPSTFQMPGLSNEYVRAMDNVHAYELRLYTARK